MMEKEREFRNISSSDSIGIMMPYYTKSSGVFLKSFVHLVDRVFGKIYLISANIELSFFSNHECIQIVIPENRNLILRIYYFLKIQFFCTYQIFRLRKLVKIWIFYLGGETMLFPLFVAKLLKIRVILMLGGSLEKEAHYSDDLFVKILKNYYRFSLSLCEKILVYSPSLVDQWNLKNFEEKIIIFPRHYIDFSKFYQCTKYSDRDKIIGYIGNFSKLKGVDKLISAMKILAIEDAEMKFMFIGSGQLNGEIETLSNSPQFSNRIIVHGWAEHSEIPKYLNMLKLLVLPSLSEGLPNIMLESMACGTPVLATPVGSIPDIITNGENGYLITDNSPETLAQQITFAMTGKKSEDVSKIASDYVTLNFSLESAVERFRKLWQ
jgi:glycosyltransferase involved in cell wall biosynthesis